MAADEIGQFMSAIKQLESSGNYNAVGPTHATYGRALGAYQIMEVNWNPWSKAALGSVADWRDPAAQDAVARYQMLRYYNMLGDWDLVAVAWFAGLGRALTAQESGVSAVSAISDVLGTSVGKYIELMRKYWPAEPDRRQVPIGLEQFDPRKDKLVALKKHQRENVMQRTVGDPKEMLRGIFSTLSDGLAAGYGERLHIDDLVPNRMTSQADRTELRSAKTNTPTEEEPEEGLRQAPDRSEVI